MVGAEEWRRRNEIDDPDQRTKETGGYFPGNPHAPAFSIGKPVNSDWPILVAVPHDGQTYPPSLLAKMRNPVESCPRLEDRHVARIGELVSQDVGVTFLRAHAPRAMLDLNRAVDDIDWSMVSGAKPDGQRHSQVNRRARSGLGLIPRRIPGVGEIWRSPITREEIDARIEAIYTPYHTALARELEALRDRFGVALLLDLHSMPPLKPTAQGEEAAEFVVGDRFGASCDGGLSDLVLRYFSGQGRRVTHNRPYAGGHMLDRYGQPRRGIHAIQLEICRSLYLDARLDRPSARLPAIALLVSGLVRTLAHEVEALGRRGGIARHAAE